MITLKDLNDIAENKVIGLMGIRSSRDNSCGSDEPWLLFVFL